MTVRNENETKASISEQPAEQVVKNICSQVRRYFSAEDKIRIILEGLRDDDFIAELVPQGRHCSESVLHSEVLEVTI